jgi:group I intron endonuclease
MIVYIATNTANGHEYVGMTTKTIEVRRKGHFNDTRAGSPCAFHRALRKYGADAFLWQVVFEGTSREEIVAEEKRLIALRQPYYNSRTCIGGEGLWGLTLETRERIGNAKRGRKLSEEHKAKIGRASRAWILGRVLDEQTRRKISESLKGQKLSAETRRKLSEARRRYTQPKEVTDKAAASRRGKRRTEEQKRRIAEGIRAYWAKKKAMS